jgi:hypothetical protein
MPIKEGAAVLAPVISQPLEGCRGRHQGVKEPATMEYTAQIQSVIGKRIDAYKGEYELWKEAHEASQLYFDIRDLVEEGLALYGKMLFVDEAWRRQVFRREIPYDAKLAGLLKQSFKVFSETLCGIESLLPPIEKKYGGVAKSDEFRRACRALRDAMTSDEEFFTSDKLVELRDSAIDEFARGECS